MKERGRKVLSNHVVGRTKVTKKQKETNEVEGQWVL